MTILSPFRETLRGIRTFGGGLRWLGRNPRCLALLFLPMLLSLGFFFAYLGFVFHNSERIFAWIMFAQPEAWWGALLYYFAKSLLYGIILIVGMALFMLGINVVAAPVYDYVSLQVERDLCNGAATEISLWASIKLVEEELKKVAFIAFITILVMVIPVVNFLSPLFTAFFLGWELYDFPLARRGWTFGQRIRFVSAHFWAILGLGLWLLIPGAQMLLMPLAVAGGTMLAIEDLNSGTKGDV